MALCNPLNPDTEPKDGVLTHFHQRGNEARTPALAATTQVIQRLVERAALYNPGELSGVFSGDRTYADAALVLQRYAHLYFMHSTMTRMINGLIEKRHQAQTSLSDSSSRTLAEQQEYENTVRTEIEQLENILREIGKVDFYAIKNAMMFFQTNSNSPDKWVSAKALETKVREEISQEKSSQGKAGFGAFLRRFIETNAMRAPSGGENDYAKDVCGQLFQGLDEYRVFCEYNFSNSAPKNEHVTDIFLREACLFSEIQGISSLYTGEGFTRSRLLAGCSTEISAEISSCIEQIVVLANRCIPIPGPRHIKQSVEEYLADYFNKIEWNVPSPTAPMPSAPPSEMNISTAPSDNLPTYLEAGLLPQEELERIANVYAIEARPLTQQVCFDAIYMGCKQGNWSQVRSLNVDLCRLTNQKGLNLLQVAVKEKDIELATVMVIQEIATNYEDVEGKRIISSVATSLHELGARLGNTREALIKYEEALEIRRKIFSNQDHLDVAECLTNSGRINLALGSYEDARVRFEEALEIWRRLSPKHDHPYILTTIIDLGHALNGLERRDEAVARFIEALNSWRELPWDHIHPNFAALLRTAGDSLMEMKRHHEALQMYQEENHVLRTIHHKQDSSEVALSLNNLGRAQKALGERDRAEEEHFKALSMLERLFPNDKFHPHLETTRAYIRDIKGWGVLLDGPRE